jgi:hypothetical protein
MNDKDKQLEVEVNQLWSYKDILFKVITSENKLVKAVATEGFTWEGKKERFTANFTFVSDNYL